MLLKGAAMDGNATVTLIWIGLVVFFGFVNGVLMC